MSVQIKQNKYGKDHWKTKQIAHVMLRKAGKALKDEDNINLKKQIFRYHSGTTKHLFTTLITTFSVVENANKINHVDQVVPVDNQSPTLLIVLVTDFKFKAVANEITIA